MQLHAHYFSRGWAKHPENFVSPGLGVPPKKTIRVYFQLNTPIFAFIGFQRGYRRLFVIKVSRLNTPSTQLP